MLAVMSYNIGVFFAALAGFGAGFLLLTDDHHPEVTKDCYDGLVGTLSEENTEPQQLLSPTACH